jgi:hypothetical protein
MLSKKELVLSEVFTPEGKKQLKVIAIEFTKDEKTQTQKQTEETFDALGDALIFIQDFMPSRPKLELVKND